MTCRLTSAQLDLSTVDARLILVARAAQDEWLPPLQDALRKALRPAEKACGFNSPAVVVMNEEYARRKGLVHPA